ncbi:MAG: radical SAM protein [Candidatus Hydrogenedentes bacterium]|nr:radical SAM protein [Candidatus Hydrogenedentota bacterium]
MVNALTRKMRVWFGETEPVRPGLYHYHRELAGHYMRLHLRIDPDRSALLSVNASGVLHLNATAAELAKSILDGNDRAASVAHVRRVYRASRADVERDYERIVTILRQLETSADACPVYSVDVPSIPPFGRKPSAPYRADLALTYACNDNCAHCYVARRPGEIVPLPLEDWMRTLEKLWDIGVPHVCFTGGEATLSPCLAPLIEKAEDLGLITGLLTNGRRLSERDYVRRLCGGGLDHVQITIESHDESIHDRMVGCEGAYRDTVQGIRNAIADDIYLVTNTTLCALNAPSIEETLEFLHGLGVRQCAMNSIINTGRAPASGLGLDEAELEPILGMVTEKAEALGLRFIWYSPTQYCQLNPAALGVGLKRCTAAEYNICIEPDGQVLPCQSYYKPVGHILNDDWKTIWESPLFLAIRNRTNLPADCAECPDLDVCGGGCPLSDGTQFRCADNTTES